MLLKTEINDSSQRVLIVAPHDTVFLKKLKNKLEGMNVDIFSTSGAVDDYAKYDVCFFVQFTNVLLPTIKDFKDTKFVFILFNEGDTAQTYASFAYEYKLQHIKVLNLETDSNHYDKDIDTIFWFTFSRSEDIFLHIYHQKPYLSSAKTKKRKKRFSLKHSITKRPKRLILLGILLLLFSQFLFLPPLLISSGLQYSAFQAYKKGDVENAKRYVVQGKSFIDLSQSLFNFSKPILHFFSIALPFEDLIHVNISSNTILATASDVETDAKALADGIFIKDKDEFEVEELIKAKSRLIENTQTLHEHVIVLEAKIPTWNPELRLAKEKLKDIEESLSMFEKISPHLDSILAKDTEKKYLLLFANNMELRPGGGFIGSYAIAKIKNYTIEDIQVYDVYDADGQLTTRIEPPQAISKFLDQPFWYLRDSAFTGDFVQNLAKAEEFLELEMGESNFDGGLLLTTTAVKNILSTVESLYIPDYKETITAENFYIKAQLYAEEDFFPGSTQKKSFLSNVMDQMILGLPEVDIPALISSLQGSLDQKQLVIHAKYPALQQIFEENYWSGRTLLPECTVSSADNCLPDYVYQLDANLGVNKANFFVQRPTDLKVDIDSSGKIINTLAIHYENNSHKGVFPGGTYKNYFQVMIPPNSFVQSVTVDGAKVEEYDETNFTYKTLGFLMTVEPQEKRRVEIIYRLPTTIVKGDGIYQLIFQKQIGSPNYDLNFSFKIPNNISITRHNLSPLAESDKILYNTSVSSDKIFLIEFSKN